MTEFLKKPHLPWVIHKRLKRLKNAYFFYRNQVANLKRKHGTEISIVFICGYHGDTGGTIAIASIANLLSRYYSVSFCSYLASNYNRKLSSRVKITRGHLPESDIYICDASCDHRTLQAMRASGRNIIVSCHGLPDELHGMEPAYLRQTLNLATRVHFVNEIQQRAFQLDENKVAIIPNTSAAIPKTRTTNNIGTVGNLDEPRKGAAETISAGLLSYADEIHLWSTSSDHWSLDSPDRVKPHHWENDKQKIYNSFDVLVFMSTQETFGLVVIEAMSAGVPCVLRRLPAFEAYADCPGVVLIDSQTPEELAEIINGLLQHKDDYRKTMREFFDAHYSGEAILREWQSLIQSLLTAQEVSDSGH
nr:glycosyltransferase family 4 protein [Marinobacter bryozoorum]